MSSKLKSQNLTVEEAMAEYNLLKNENKHLKELLEVKEYVIYLSRSLNEIQHKNASQTPKTEESKEQIELENKKHSFKCMAKESIVNPFK